MSFTMQKLQNEITQNKGDYFCHADCISYYTVKSNDSGVTTHYNVYFATAVGRDDETVVRSSEIVVSDYDNEMVAIDIVIAEVLNIFRELFNKHNDRSQRMKPSRFSECWMALWKSAVQKLLCGEFHYDEDHPNRAVIVLPKYIEKGDGEMEISSVDVMKVQYRTDGLLFVLKNEVFSVLSVGSDKIMAFADAKAQEYFNELEKF